jgi:hypothetical protein
LKINVRGFNMKDREQKIFYIITYTLLGIVAIGFLIFLWLVGGMIDDHNCWQDGYHDEHCWKYIRGNE